MTKQKEKSKDKFKPKKDDLVFIYRKKEGISQLVFYGIVKAINKTKKEEKKW